MKIAVVTDSYFPTRDGVVACIAVMDNVLTAAGHKVTVVAPDPGKAEDRRDGVIYFRSIKFSSYAGYFVPIFPSNKIEVMKSIDPDVVHVQGIAVMALKGIIAAHQLGIPVIVTFHTMVGDTMKYYSPVKMPQDVAERLVWTYLRYLMRWADAIVAPSQSTANELKDHGIPIHEMRIIPTPVDTCRFRPEVDGSKIRARYHLEGKRVIVCVGRVSFEKEIELLVRAVKLLDSDVVLLVVGKGPAMDSVRKTAEGLCISDRVILTGFVPDDELVEHYGAADAAATASRFETQCLSALEAMACGLPVACANARAFADYVVDGKNGFLFEQNPDNCAAALKKALAAGDAVKKAAVATAEEFSVDSFTKKMTELYQFVIDKKKGTKGAEIKGGDAKRSKI
jgi:1,2-diacylglycerol 3-alpha-glucosyltransferase